jgi:hypothetical protein
MDQSARFGVRANMRIDGRMCKLRINKLPNVFAIIRIIHRFIDPNENMNQMNQCFLLNI